MKNFQNNFTDFDLSRIKKKAHIEETYFEIEKEYQTK